MDYWQRVNDAITRELGGVKEGVCQQAGTAPLGKPEPATPSRPSGRVSTDADRRLASIIMDHDRWDCGCDKCHDELAAIIAHHRQNVALQPIGAAALIQAIAQEARRYAGFYANGSDGRNTFEMFAEFVETRAIAQAIETRSAETAGLSPQGESAVVEDHAPGA